MQQATARIVSWNENGLAICGSAAKISTTPGNAEQILQATANDAKSAELIGKVLRSGHRSVIEHAVFTIAFWNVSVFVEQFFIECRLASFTVKSRRYVDFSSQGFYTPPELTADAKDAYERVMKRLFAAYGELLNCGVPKEDARFLLPYSFCSSFYCTLNARELFSVIEAMRFGRGSRYPELRELGRQLAEQLAKLFPVAVPSRAETSGPEAQTARCACRIGAPSLLTADRVGRVELLQTPAQAEQILNRAQRLFRPDEARLLTPKELIREARPRELEQLSYSFQLSDISLSGITHLVRHRMQSVLVPPIASVDHARLVLPDTVARDPEAERIYRGAFSATLEAVQSLSACEELARYSYYFALSGNTLDVMTTMNARELLLFIKLRSCERAQWEIRELSARMLKLLRASCPPLFDCYGPSCVVTGRCPEGRLSCGKMEEMKQRFTAKTEKANDT